MIDREDLRAKSKARWLIVCAAGTAAAVAYSVLAVPAPGTDDSTSEGIRRAASNANRSADAAEWTASVESADSVDVVLKASVRDVIIGETISLHASVSALGQDRVSPTSATYTWRCGGGVLDNAEGQNTRWRAPGEPGRYKIGVAVRAGDARGRKGLYVTVRLPSPRSPEDLQVAMRTLADERAERMEDHPQRASIEARIEELRAVSEVRKTMADRRRAADALEEMADHFGDLGRFTDAMDTYQLVLDGIASSDRRFKPIQNKLGKILLLRGFEDEAREALFAAGPYAFGMSRYYLAELLERNGETEEARLAYGEARQGVHWFPDPVYRYVLLSLESGAIDGEQAAQLLVDASPRLDGDLMTERLARDPEMAPLWAALEEGQRVDDLAAWEPHEPAPDIPDPVEEQEQASGELVLVLGEPQP